MDKVKYVVLTPTPVTQGNQAVRYNGQGQSAVILDEGQRCHRDFKTPLLQYLRYSRWLVVLSAPLIYLCLIPFLLLDLFNHSVSRSLFPDLWNPESPSRGLSDL
jgi:hypothetical protein